VRDADAIKRGIAEFARGSNEGLIVVGPPSSIALINRKPGLDVSVKDTSVCIVACVASTD
jgi:hypothetical protein